MREEPFFGARMTEEDGDGTGLVPEQELEQGSVL